jgi:hypothetical protein
MPALSVLIFPDKTGLFRVVAQVVTDGLPDCLRNTDLALPAQSLQSDHPYHRGAGMARNFRHGLADP